MTDEPLTPLQQINRAMDVADVDEMERLLRLYPELLRTEDGLDRFLWRAAQTGSLLIVQMLVRLGMGVNETNGKVDGPIYDAACQGHLNVVRWLLDHGAIINTIREGQRRCMPLMGAARKGHLDVVILLVERGADIHSHWHGMNALMHAERRGQREIMAYLRSIGARDLRETSPPDYAAAHREIIEYRGPLSDWKRELPGDPAVTIHCVPPNERNPQAQTLLTLGLSDRRLPTEWGEFDCGELQLALPIDWPLDSPDPQFAWPLAWLKRIVLDLRTRDRWPTSPVLFPNGEPPVPFHSSTALCAWMCVVEPGGSLQMPDCRWVDLHQLYPIYAEELQLVRSSGEDALIDRLEARGLPIHVQPDRPNVADDPDPSA